MPPVFVYGSLRRGQAHHALLRAAAYVGPAATPPRYTLVDLGAHPAMLSGGTTAIQGEVYEVPEATLAELDRFEEHPRVYRRQTIALAGGEPVQAYLLLPGRRQGAREIPGGRWPPPGRGRP